MAGQKWCQQVQKLVAAHIAIGSSPPHTSVAAPEDGLCAREHRPLHVLSARGDGVQRFIDAVGETEWFRRRRWLLLPPSDGSATSLAGGSRAPPLDSEVLVARRSGRSGTVELLELYGVTASAQARVQPYASWDFARGLHVVTPDPCALRRRADLSGLVITAAALNISPTSQVWLEDSKIIYGGYIGNLWNVLEEKLGFRTDYHIVPPDIGTGTENNGAWNGVVGMIAQGQIDVALELYSMTTKRTSVVDFSSPVYIDRFYIFVRRVDGLKVGWKGLVAPFTRRLWTQLLVLALTLCAFLYFVWIVCRRCGITNTADWSVHSPLCIVCYIFGILFCNQGD